MRRVTAMPSLRATTSGIAWPAMPTGSAATLANLVYELDRTQWLSGEAVVAAQFAQLGVLARHLAASIPSFRDRLARSGLRPDDLARPDGLAQLPPLSREEIVATGEELFARRVPQGHAPLVTTRTSGSTGTPVTVRTTAVTNLLWDALTIRDHLWRGMDFRERVLAIRSGVKVPIEQPDWGPPTSTLYSSGPLAALPLFEPIEVLADRCVDFGPGVLIVYSSVLDALIAHFAQTGARPSGLRFIHSYAELLAPSVRAAATSAFDAVVWDTYSCEEVGNVAADCPNGDGLHVLAEGVLVEILDEHDRPCPVGGIGRVVVTELHNVATPLVRYDLGDYAEVGAACPCGRGLPTLARIVGRERNRARLPDRTWTWPQAVPLVRYREVAPVRQVQLVQQPDGGVDVLAVVDRAPGAAALEALTAMVHASLGHPFPLRFVWRDQPIPRTRGAKFEPFRRVDAGDDSVSESG